MIVELVKDGKKVDVTTVNHKVIHNLLDEGDEPVADFHKAPAALNAPFPIVNWDLEKMLAEK